MKISALVLMVLLAGCAGEYEPSQQYCEMWEIWHISGGEWGWPDQERRFYSECQ